MPYQLRYQTDWDQYNQYHYFEKTYRKRLLGNCITIRLENYNMYKALLIDSDIINKVANTFNGKKGNKSISDLNRAMPQLLQFAQDYMKLNETQSALPTNDQIRHGIANRLGAFELLRDLGLEKGSASETSLLKFIGYLGTSQLQRADFVRAISGKAPGALSGTRHLFNSFAEMLPSAFRDIHSKEGNAYLVNPKDSTALSQDERSYITSLLKSNAYFARAAESAGFAARQNGRMYALKNITRNQINEAAAHMYDTLVESAKGMPMYGITDVNDPDKWENIAQKTNAPLLGTLGA